MLFGKVQTTDRQKATRANYTGELNKGTDLKITVQGNLPLDKGSSNFAYTFLDLFGKRIFRTHSLWTLPRLGPLTFYSGSSGNLSAHCPLPQKAPRVRVFKRLFTKILSIGPYKGKSRDSEFKFQTDHGFWIQISNWIDLDYYTLTCLRSREPRGYF